MEKFAFRKYHEKTIKRKKRTVLAKIEAVRERYNEKTSTEKQTKMNHTFALFVQSMVCLLVGLLLDTMHETRMPLIIMDIAKLLAYLGASVSFWKLLFGKKKTEEEK